MFFVQIYKYFCMLPKKYLWIFRDVSVMVMKCIYLPSTLASNPFAPPFFGGSLFASICMVG